VYVEVRNELEKKKIGKMGLKKQFSFPE